MASNTTNFDAADDAKNGSTDSEMYKEILDPTFSTATGTTAPGCCDCLSSVCSHPQVASAAKRLRSESTKNTQEIAEAKMDLSEQINRRKPTVVIFVGMAGSGKTTLVSSFRKHLPSCNHCGLILNLDPAAVVRPRYSSYDIMDVRNVLQYKEVLKHYKVGHNAGILLSLDLVAHEFDKVISVIEKKADMFDYILVDTPSQMNMIYDSSSAGAVIVKAFALKFPTVIAYVIDTPGCSGPYFPLSTVLQACDLYHKTRLCPVLTFNKIEQSEGQFDMEWKEVRDKFEKAASYLYSSSIAQILGVSLGEFSQNMKSVGVTATTRDGLGDFFMAVEESAKAYVMRTYECSSHQYMADIDRGKGAEVLGDNPDIAVKSVVFAADLKDEKAWTRTNTLE